MNSHISISPTRPMWFINVRAIHRISDAEDRDVPGIYSAVFVHDLAEQSASKMASTVLDNFHEQVSIGTLDDFSIDVLDDLGQTVQEDAEHESYSSSKFGVIIGKISDVALYIDVQQDCQSLCSRIEGADEPSMVPNDDDLGKTISDLLMQMSNHVTAIQTAHLAAIKHEIVLAQFAQFAQIVAGFRVWDYTRKNGEPYDECDPPTEGTTDSHNTLMNLIEQARTLQ